MKRELSRSSAVAAIVVTVVAVILLGIYLIDRPETIGPQPGLHTQIVSGGSGALKSLNAGQAMPGKMAPAEASRVFR